MKADSATLPALLTHSGWLRRFARGLLRERDAADDLVQETLVAGWSRPPALDRDLRPWLATVARNRAIDEHRRRQADSATEEALAAPGALPVAPSPEALVGDAEIHREVASIVVALEEPFRTAVLLRYYEGLTATEIAQQLGVPAGTVRWRLHEALAQVRRRLDERHGARDLWMRALAPLASPGFTGKDVGAEGAGNLSADGASSPRALGRASLALGARLALVPAIAGSLWFASTLASRDPSGATAAPVSAASTAAAAQEAPAPPSHRTAAAQRGAELAGPEALKRSLAALAAAVPLRDAGATAAPPPAFVSDRASIRGSLDPEIVRRVIRRHVGEVHACYERARALAPALEGRIAVSFTIAENGAVMQATTAGATFQAPGLERCLIDGLLGWEFPKPPAGDRVAVTYPFTFTVPASP